MVKGEIGKLLRVYFKPRTLLPPDEWAEQNIRLSPKTSNLSGRYSLRHTPYLRQIYKDIGNPRVRKVIIQKGAQLGLTQLAQNILLYYICNYTFPLLAIYPSKELAQQVTERSFRPTIDLCKAAGEFLTGNPDDLKKTEFLFKSCIARFLGGGSPAKLSSNPACVVVLDEVDKYSDFDAEGEAPPLELAEDRTLTFPHDKKIIVLSTPTQESTSVVSAEFKRGSQSYYYVPCPRCRTHQVLKFENIKFDQCKEGGAWNLDRVEKEARYQCDHCKALLGESDKIEMVRRGEWRETNPNAPKEIKSYQISALYSFNITWGSLAKVFLMSKDDIGKLRNFYNSFLGLCFEERKATIKEGDVDLLIKESVPYNTGELPTEPRVLLLGADVQKDSLYYIIQSFDMDGASYVIDYGQVPSFEDLRHISKLQFKYGDSHYGIFKGVIDTGGDRTAQVYDFILSTGGLFVGFKGYGQRGLYAPVRQSKINYKGYSLPLVFTNDKYWKDHLYIQGIKYRKNRLYLPQDCSPDFKEQLVSERLVETKNKRGFLEADWVCTNKRNHYGDILKYLEAAKFMLAPHLEVEEEPAPEPEPTPEPVSSWDTW